MADQFPTLKDGDVLEPWHINVIFQELRRWRKLKGTGRVTVNGADSSDGSPTISMPDDVPFFIQLSGPYSGGYPWVEVVIGPGRTISTTGVYGDSSTDDLAYERQTGDTTLTADGTVYEARRCPGSNELSFDGKN